jgi:hypothetical protein
LNLTPRSCARFLTSPVRARISSRLILKYFAAVGTVLTAGILALDQFGCGGESAPHNDDRFHDADHAKDADA